MRDSGKDPRRSTVDELIVAAVRCHLRDDDAAEVADRLEAFRDGDELLRHADAEGVAGILAEILAEHDSPLAASFRSRHHRIFAHGARTLEVLENLGEAFAQAGLRAIVLKGASLLAGPYRQHLGRRPVSDLDLLVRRSELPAVAEVLSGLGLRPLATRWRGDGIEIDLHTDLVRSELIGHRRTAYGFSERQVWGSSVPCPIGGQALLVLAPELQISHLAVHAVKHAFGRWIWLVDLAWLLSTIQPADLLTAASAVRAERALAYCAQLLRQELGVETPRGKLRLPELNRLETEWLRLVAARKNPMGLGRVVAGLSIPGLLDRFAYWREVAFPSAHTLRQASVQTSGLRARRHWLTATLAPRLGQALRLLARSAGLGTIMIFS